MSVRPQTKDKPSSATFQWDDPMLLDDQASRRSLATISMPKPDSPL